VPVIDLRKRLNLPAGELSRTTRIAIVEVEGLSVGMIVDFVSETFRLSADQVEPASPVIVGVDADYLVGVAKVGERLVILLDLARVLAKGARIAV
jgi:purine-binding chemotaxis protein CheW